MSTFWSSSVIKCNAPINVNPVAGGGGGGRVGVGVRARGGDLMPETRDYPHVGLLIVRSDPGVGTFDFDRQLRSLVFLVSVQKRLPGPFLEAF